MIVLNNLIRSVPIGAPLFAQRRKCSLTAAVGIGTAIAGMIGSGISAAGSASANRRGERLAKWQTAQNREEAAINRQWQEDMYKKYSTVQSQADQYRAAGLNPYLGDVTGQAFSGSGAQAEAAGFTPQNELQSFESLGSTAANAASAAANLQNADSQAKSVDSLSKLQSQQIENMKEDNRGMRYANNFLRDAYQYRLSNERWQAQKAENESFHEQYLMQDAKYKALTSAFMYGSGMPSTMVKQAEQQLFNSSMQAVLMSDEHGMNSVKFKQLLWDYAHANAYLQATQLQAQAADRSSRAAMVNAETSKELMPHQAGLLDAQAQDTRNASNLKGQELYMSRKWQSRMAKQNYLLMNYQIDSYKRANPWIGVNNAVNAIESFSRTARNTTEAITSIKTKGVSSSVQTPWHLQEGTYGYGTSYTSR